MYMYLHAQLFCKDEGSFSLRGGVLVHPLEIFGFYALCCRIGCGHRGTWPRIPPRLLSKYAARRLSRCVEVSKCFTREEPKNPNVSRCRLSWLNVHTVGNTSGLHSVAVIYAEDVRKAVCPTLDLAQKTVSTPTLSLLRAMCSRCR